LIERYTWEQIRLYFREEQIRAREQIADLAVGVNRGFSGQSVDHLRRE